VSRKANIVEKETVGSTGRGERSRHDKVKTPGRDRNIMKRSWRLRRRGRCYCRDGNWRLRGVEPVRLTWGLANVGPLGLSFATFACFRRALALSSGYDVSS